MNTDIFQKLVLLSKNEDIPKELVDVLYYLVEKKSKKTIVKDISKRYSCVKSFIQSYHIKTSETHMVSKNELYDLYISFCIRFKFIPIASSVFWPALEKELSSIENHFINLEGKLKKRDGTRERYVYLSFELL
ncbi:hypothetical protein [Flavobacterium sp.]|jgi:hypothetical protein|uniref:hypothetical protein n=1 Tax=Flavobacterium sp. TaxID=239 RepID=UPI0037C0C1AC